MSAASSFNITAPMAPGAAAPGPVGKTAGGALAGFEALMGAFFPAGADAAPTGLAAPPLASEGTLALAADTAPVEAAGSALLLQTAGVPPPAPTEAGGAGKPADGAPKPQLVAGAAALVETSGTPQAPPAAAPALAEATSQADALVTVSAPARDTKEAADLDAPAAAAPADPAAMPAMLALLAPLPAPRPAAAPATPPPSEPAGPSLPAAGAETLPPPQAPTEPTAEAAPHPAAPTSPLKSEPLVLAKPGDLPAAPSPAPAEPTKTAAPPAAPASAEPSADAPAPPIPAQAAAAPPAAAEKPAKPQARPARPEGASAAAAAVPAVRPGPAPGAEGAAHLDATGPARAALGDEAEPQPAQPRAQAADPQAAPAEPAPAPPAASPSAAPHAAAAAAVRGSPETVASLAAQIAKKLGARSTQFDVQLDPAGLGRVNVRVEINADGRVSAAMSFDNPQAAAELKSRASELQRALAQSGFDVSGGLSFDVAQDRGGSYPGQQNAFHNGDSPGQSFRGRAFAAALENAGDAAQAALSDALNFRRLTPTGVDVRV